MDLVAPFLTALHTLLLFTNVVVKPNLIQSDSV
jgi:hypothetical protein